MRTCYTLQFSWTNLVTCSSLGVLNFQGRSLHHSRVAASRSGVLSILAERTPVRSVVLPETSRSALEPGFLRPGPTRQVRLGIHPYRAPGPYPQDVGQEVSGTHPIFSGGPGARHIPRPSSDGFHFYCRGRGNRAFVSSGEAKRSPEERRSRCRSAAHVDQVNRPALQFPISKTIQNHNAPLGFSMFFHLPIIPFPSFFHLQLRPPATKLTAPAPPSLGSAGVSRLGLGRISPRPRSASPVPPSCDGAPRRREPVGGLRGRGGLGVEQAV